MPIARLRYVSSIRRRWERYPLLCARRRIEELLEEIESDPICTFWG